jgi:hypothetical protein
MLVIAIFAAISVYFPSAHAFTASPCIRRDLNCRFGDLLKPVGIFGIPDRRTEKEWAEENGMKLNDVQKRYAATGTLKCKNLQLSADLVMVDDIIVTSSHIFKDKKTCAKVEDPKNCKFMVKVGNEMQTVNLGAIIDDGFKNCPPKPSDDWAIVRLKKKIKGISPYAVDASQEISSNQTVSSVTALNFDLYRNKKRLPVETKTIGKCTSAHIYMVESEAGLFSTDCDGSEGQSGGAILNDDPHGPPVLLGIHRSVSETEQQLKSAIARGEANAGDFDEDHWANRHVALRGQFLKSLLEAVQK